MRIRINFKVVLLSFKNYQILSVTDSLFRSLGFTCGSTQPTKLKVRVQCA